MTVTFLTRRILKSLVVAGAGIAGLSACSSSPSSYNNGPKSWGNIEIAETVERLELYSRPDGMQLSVRDEEAVAQFLQTYGRFGDGPLYINMPSGQNAGAYQTQQLVKRIMGNVGLGGAPIQSGQYQVAMGQVAPVVVSYRRLKAIPKDCRNLGDLTHTYDNQPYDNFGCSTYANMAAMVEDPRQFLEPYPVTSPDIKRRMQVYDRYIAGSNTASALPSRQAVSSGD